VRFIVTVVLLGAMLLGNEGKLLFYGNCIACHGELGKQAAPPLQEVKGYYLLKYPKKEAFVDAMSRWLLAPNEEHALHKEAIAKYKLMPYLAIDKETLRSIATYIYDSNDFGVADGIKH